MKTLCIAIFLSCSLIGFGQTHKPLNSYKPTADYDNLHVVKISEDDTELKSEDKKTVQKAIIKEISDDVVVDTVIDLKEYIPDCTKSIRRADQDVDEERDEYRLARDETSEAKNLLDLKKTNIMMQEKQMMII